MYVFKSQVRDSYLATNPKVLTRTLLSQKSLARVTGKIRYAHMIAKNINPALGPEYIMLARNPFLRVESFFKEKLRLRVRQALDPVDPYLLKRHQELFYPRANIAQGDSLEDKVRKLLSIRFEDFVEELPKVIEYDDHLRSQTGNFAKSFFRKKFYFPMNRYVPSPNCSKTLSQY